MAAMMLPSVLPVILVLIRFGGSAHAAGFIAGYLVAWGGFSVAATLVHWALLKAALVSPMMESASVALSAAVLAVAGLFQFTPLKHACLVRCRSPWGAVLNQSSATIAMREGFRHGAFCVGCCWVLMALLFVAGVMNLLWIAVIAAYVIAEKWAPGAEWFSRAVGVVPSGGRGVRRRRKLKTSPVLATSMRRLRCSIRSPCLGGIAQIAAPEETSLHILRGGLRAFSYQEGERRVHAPDVRLWPTAAPDVCDGTSAVGESRHRSPRRIRWSSRLLLSQADPARG